MNLVFKEYIQFLHDNNVNYPLEEGYYWQDNTIIKAFDKQGNVHKILRLYIDNELNITYKVYSEEKFQLASWYDIVYMNMDHLLFLEAQSLFFIEDTLSRKKDRIPISLISGGKDSTVQLHLVKHYLPNIQAIFNNSTLDCADTYKYIKKEKNITILTHSEGFYKYRERLNFIPTRLTRVCCKIYKEQEMMKYLDSNIKYLFFMGMRNDESSSRKKYTDFWINSKWGHRDWIAALPIRKWTEFDIWLYILFRNLNFNEKYRKGYKRVGCAVACPFYSKTTWILDKYWYHFLYNRWHKILEKDFIDNKKSCVLNCTLQEYHTCWNGGILRDSATPEVINEFSELHGLSPETSAKYFNKTCIECSKKLKKDDIALSMKFYGRHIEKFKCIKCLALDLHTTEKELKQRAKVFKQDGCNLF